MSDKQKIVKNFAQVLTEALPFIRRYQGKTIVIKYGGNAMIDKDLKNSFCRDIVLMKLVGINPVVVHGGGPQINNQLVLAGKKSKFIDGLRVTDNETMNIVEMVLGGSINKEIVQLINQNGGFAVGLTGKDGGLINASKLSLKKSNSNDSETDIGQVGKINYIETRLIEVLEAHRFIPVIAPIGVDDEGITYNINADSVAGEIACALKAQRLMLLTNTPGVIDGAGKLIKKLVPSEIKKLIDQGVIQGGMIPKIQCALKAAENNVDASIILDGRIEHVTLLELFSNDGIGTLITKE